MGSGTAEDALEAGVVMAAALALGVYFLLIQNTDSPAEAVTIFGRMFYALIFALVPTSEFAVFLDVIAGTVGAAITADKLRSEGVGLLMAFGFGWTAMTIIINWFNAPI